MPTVNQCRFCLVVLSGSNWYPSHQKKSRYICKSCNQQEQKKYYAQGRKSKKINRLLLKQEIINNYGGKCNCCQEDNWQFLTIDHINGGGNKHRKKLGHGGGDNFYRILKNNNFPKKDYQLLCYNCNMTRGHQGFCPCELTKTKTCSFCQAILNDQNQLEFNIKNNHNICINCIFQFSRSKKVNKNSIYQKNRRLNQRHEIIKNYGGKCACCYLSEPYHLSLDHINNNGSLERQSGLAGSNLYNFIIKNNYPKNNYQILCHNCNSVKSSYGFCTHQKDISISGLISEISI